MTDNQNSGGISGAITNLDSKEAQMYAIQAYESIRNNQHDVEKIAKNLNMDEGMIKAIKGYLFYGKCAEGENGEKKRFDPSFAIAQSWNRLAYEPENIQEHDRLLIQHEIMEIHLATKGLPQSVAHDETSKKFDYAGAAIQYYEKLREKQKHSRKETEVDVETMEYLEKLVQESEGREDSKKRFYVSGALNVTDDEFVTEALAKQEEFFKARLDAIKNIDVEAKPKTNLEKLQRFCKKALMQHYTDDYRGYMIEGVKSFLLSTPNVKLEQMTKLIEVGAPVAAFDSEEYRYSEFVKDTIRQDKQFRKQLANRDKTPNEVLRR